MFSDARDRRPDASRLPCTTSLLAHPAAGAGRIPARLPLQQQGVRLLWAALLRRRNRRIAARLGLSLSTC